MKDLPLQTWYEEVRVKDTVYVNGTRMMLHRCVVATGNGRLIDECLSCSSAIMLPSLITTETNYFASATIVEVTLHIEAEVNILVAIHLPK